MAATKVSKAISDLKLEADKLAPKPSIVFGNVHKLQSAAVITAAKNIDSLVEGTDASTAPATLKAFTDAATKFFTNLGNVAAKEPTAIKAKLGTLIDAAEKEAVAAGKTEVDFFVKAMAGRPRSTTVDPKPLEALKDHIEVRKRGVKEVEKHLVVAEKALDSVKANRTKGQLGLDDSKKILELVRTAENKVSQGGDFLKGRLALAPAFTKTLNTGPYPKDLVAKLRKEDGQVFDDGMRVMAEARDLRTEIIKEIAEHELELDRAESDNAKDEKSQLAQIGKAEVDFKKLGVDTLKVVNKLENSAWGKIEAMTNNDQEDAYKAKVEETNEAFRSLPLLNTTLQSITKRVEIFRGKAATPKVLETINSLQSEMARLRGTFRSAAAAVTEYKNLVTKCGNIWKEREEGV